MILLRISSVIMLTLFVISCQSPSEPVHSIEDFPLQSLAKSHKHCTGSIEFVRLGTKGNQNTDKLNFAEFNVHEERRNKQAAGTFYYRVYGTDLLLHREIVVEVSDVFIDETKDKGWFVGEVISDSKGCGSTDHGGHDSGSSSGDHTDECSGDDSGHDSGCSGDDGTEHTDGGCSGDDGTDHTDGGCSGDDGTDHTDGGCSGDDGTDHTDGGCSGDDDGDHTDGGCSGDDDGDHTDGGGGSGTTNGNWHVSGKTCRTGQVIAVKIHDVASPGADGDGITWKWFHPENPIVQTLYTANRSAWPHLCKKTIIGGNLSVHY